MERLDKLKDLIISFFKRAAIDWKYLTIATAILSVMTALLYLQSGQGEEKPSKSEAPAAKKTEAAKIPSTKTPAKRASKKAVEAEPVVAKSPEASAPAQEERGRTATKSAAKGAKPAASPSRYFIIIEYLT